MSAIRQLTDEDRNQLQIARTIHEQLGGRRFDVMTGAHEFTVLQSGLRFKIGRNSTPANRIEVIYTADDLYAFRAIRVSLNRKTWHCTVKTVSESTGLYFDQLQPEFTRITGLETHL